MSKKKATDFGALVRDRRTQLGWTQQRAAEAAGLTVGAVSLLERGETRRPHRATIRVLLEVLSPQGDGQP